MDSFAEKQIIYYQPGICDESVKNRQKKKVPFNKSLYLIFRLKNLFSMKQLKKIY